jgi:signal peptidase II
MDRLSRRGAGIVFGTAAVVYLLDRLTKTWAENSLAERAPIEVIPGILRFRFATNPGGAFSLGTSAPWFFATATIVVSGLIVASAFRPRSGWQALAMGLVLGGALGNLTDRAIRGPRMLGEVVDFIDVGIWPVFNIADTAVVLGAILLAVTSFRTPKDEAADTVASDAH